MQTLKHYSIESRKRYKFPAQAGEHRNRRLSSFRSPGGRGSQCAGTGRGNPHILEHPACYVSDTFKEAAKSVGG